MVDVDLAVEEVVVVVFVEGVLQGVAEVAFEEVVVVEVEVSEAEGDHRHFVLHLKLSLMDPLKFNLNVN